MSHQSEIMVTVEQLRSFVADSGLMKLKTLRYGCVFSVFVSETAFHFTPESSGTRRGPTTWDHAEDYVNRFNETGSLKPSEYDQVRRNASYMLPLIVAYLNSK